MPHHQCHKCGSYLTKLHSKTKGGSQRIYCYDCGKTSTLNSKGKGGHPFGARNRLFTVVLSATKKGKPKSLPFACWAKTPQKAKSIALKDCIKIFPAGMGWNNHSCLLADITHMTTTDEELFDKPIDVA